MVNRQHGEIRLDVNGVIAGIQNLNTAIQNMAEAVPPVINRLREEVREQEGIREYHQTCREMAMKDYDALIAVEMKYNRHRIREPKVTDRIECGSCDHEWHGLPCDGENYSTEIHEFVACQCASSFKG